ncbi:MAG: DUF3050 domain-containing protein [Algoriphagus sp.]|jgi:hypothetical protein|uniref:DUF3050 domain-containing protein n=1 Tax=Algoriphagus sp. TaxID=1872435 RepID=UPI002608BC61|nr:DUF3050 domain-containing protein [Algoriphagus sp.]MDG1278217.1 DUF3050 domain-containing protein [Algoriphagus sp.]
MNERIFQLKSKIEPLRKEIVNHKVYNLIQDTDDLKIFMQYHVFAVWDFMSLLKSLQNSLTCTSIPWFPIGSADTRFLINEIVVGEESDVDSYGVRKSHFELYLDSMCQCGANTSQIELFLNNLKNNKNLEQSLKISHVPLEASDFVDFTFKVINSQKSYLQSAVFTFGREDLIPDMFHSIVNDIYKKFPEKVSVFKYYLERHIEVDGDHHSHLALEMTANLCGDNDEFWEEAERVSIEALKMRIKLWDGVYREIENKNKN